MNKKMISYYNDELSFLKDMGKDFARQYPKVAARLDLDFQESPDPYVERLLEGVSFLTARTQLKIDAEYPKFVSRILEAVHPQFLCPLPSATVLKFSGSEHHSNYIHKLKRGHVLNSLPIELPNQEISCKFSTTQDIELTPITLESSSYSLSTEYIPQSLLGKMNAPPRSVLRLDFSAVHAERCSDLIPDDLSIFLGKDLSVSSKLLNLLINRCKKVICHSYENPQDWMHAIAEKPVHTGFLEEEALTFNLDRSVSGIRLFQEYIQLPEKFTFIKQGGIKQTLAKAEDSNQFPIKGTQLEKIVVEKDVNKRIVTYEKRWFSLSFVFDDYFIDLQNLIKPDSLSINSLPVVNLFRNKSIRIPVKIQAQEHHVVVDKMQPLNFEVYSVEQVKGFDIYNNQIIAFSPIYQTKDLGLFHQYEESVAFFSLRREKRISSKTAVVQRRKTSYMGSEVFVTLANEKSSIFESGVEQLSVDAWCTNRDLPLVLPRSKKSDFLIEHALPIDRIQIVTRVTKPNVAVDGNESTWSLLNQINLSYVSLQGHSPRSAAEHLKKLLLSFPFVDEDVLIKSQIESIRELSVDTVQKIIRNNGAGSLVKGVSITLTLDESLMSGIHPYLFCSILRHFFLRSVSLNSFVRLSVETLQQGKIIEWPEIIGSKVVL